MTARNKAIFLDRDGVINHDPGDYTRSLEEFNILPTVFETLKKLDEAGVPPRFDYESRRHCQRALFPR